MQNVFLSDYIYFLWLTVLKSHLFVQFQDLIKALVHDGHLGKYIRLLFFFVGCIAYGTGFCSHGWRHYLVTINLIGYILE